MVIFSGNWRESGGEGLIYKRLEDANLPEKDQELLASLVLEVEALQSEKLGFHKTRVEGIVLNLSRLIGLNYSQYLASREHALAQSIHEGLQSMPVTSLHDACVATGGVLGQMCEQLDVEFAIFFTNAGPRNRLDFCSCAGIPKKRVQGLYIAGKPREVLEKVGHWQSMGREERDSWVSSDFHSQGAPSIPKRLAEVEEMLPIELGSSFCGILAIGPRAKSHKPQEHVMAYADHRQLSRVAQRNLRNGLRDIVQRQEAAELLVRTSHILRGPLMGIQGEIEALKHYLATGKLEKTDLRKICDNIQDQIDGIAAQAEIMEEAPKTTLGGRGEAWFRPAPLGALVSKVVDGMAGKARERSITFGGLAELDSLPEVEFDWNQMRVVFANLLHNACKYAHQDSRIWFRAARIQLSDRPAVRITVANVGTGISRAEIHADIFRPGFRGTIRDKKRDVEGEGMGLAVCKDIVQNVHHGRIWAQCTERGGNIGSYQDCLVMFIVEIPLKQPSTIPR
jgi:signal transduction histidine kinase